MDARKLVDSLDKKEYEELRSAVWNRDVKEAEIEAEHTFLTDGEKRVLYDLGKIPAITELRKRVGCSLHCAKIVVERYEEQIKADMG